MASVEVNVSDVGVDGTAQIIESVDSTNNRTHFKIGSRKSKLAMVQSEYIASTLKELHPNFTFEIVNFDTKGDKILNIALPKIGDKGLFTKELEDALEDGSIDFVVHSLKDMPCQTLPDRLIIAGVPEREDASDALVMAERWHDTKKSLDDLADGSVVGTSSLRRIAQLKMKYPRLKFETIRGNLQTRFAKLDATEDVKFDAIILATAGLKRLDYKHRITQILGPNVCMHAVSQGALGVECRRDDMIVIKMLNEINHEETVLRCIAERTFLAKLEGGCSAPIAVESKVTAHSILLEGAVFDLEGTKRIYDKFEIKFDKNASTLCPVISLAAAVMANDDDVQAGPSSMSLVSSNKRKVSESSTNDEDEDDNNNKTHPSDLNNSSSKKLKVESNDDEIGEEAPKAITKHHYSFICDLKIDECKLIKSELCGLHLAEKLKEKGADVLINEIKSQINKSF